MIIFILSIISVNLTEYSLDRSRVASRLFRDYPYQNEHKYPLLTREAYWFLFHPFLRKPVLHCRDTEKLILQKHFGEVVSSLGIHLLSQSFLISIMSCLLDWWFEVKIYRATFLVYLEKKIRLRVLHLIENPLLPQQFHPFGYSYLRRQMFERESCLQHEDPPTHLLSLWTWDVPQLSEGERLLDEHRGYFRDLPGNHEDSVMEISCNAHLIHGKPRSYFLHVIMQERVLS